MKYRVRRNLRRILNLLRDRIVGPKSTYVDGRVEEYGAIWRRAADRIGATFWTLAPDVWEVRSGDRMARIVNHKVGIDNPAVLEVAAFKSVCCRLIAEVAADWVPPHVTFHYGRPKQGLAFMDQHEGPFVVKPARGTGSGCGVTTLVSTRREYRRAVILAATLCPEVILETQAPGESYRLLCLGGRLIHAVRRTGPRVVGDGTRAIRELAGPAGAADRDGLFTLSRQGLTPDSVPAAGREVLVRSCAPSCYRREEMRTVYDADATHLIGEPLRRAAEAVARALRSELAGVDVVTLDPSGDPGETGGRILEVNTTPGLHHHEPGPGEPPNDAAASVLRYALESSWLPSGSAKTK